MHGIALTAMGMATYGAMINDMLTCISHIGKRYTSVYIHGQNAVHIHRANIWSTDHMAEDVGLAHSTKV
eukprot:6195715-Pleurochrysis_carterae.AAC.3